MYKKTIAGVGQIDMTTEEIAERQAEELTPLKQPEPTDIEIRLAALEAKVGVTQQDKDAAASDLRAAIGLKDG